MRGRQPEKRLQGAQAIGLLLHSPTAPDALALRLETVMEGRIERRDTFAGRNLDPTPKFVRERLARAEADAENGRAGTGDAAYAG